MRKGLMRKWPREFVIRKKKLKKKNCYWLLRSCKVQMARYSGSRNVYPGEKKNERAKTKWRPRHVTKCLLSSIRVVINLVKVEEGCENMVVIIKTPSCLNKIGVLPFFSPVYTDNQRGMNMFCIICCSSICH